MKFDVVTIFPEFIENMRTYGVIGKGIEKELISLNTVNPREFSKDKHRRVDDEIYGGGVGMLMTAQPLYDSIMSVKDEKAKVIYLSPQGSLLNQKMVCDLAKEEHLVLVCGHYEGIDQRIIDKCIDLELSIGDYVLSGGEIPAMAIIDSVSRFIPGVLGKIESATEDSLYDGLLKYPCYTRPYEFMGAKVPDILISGNHKLINEWKKKKSIEVTKEKRPDLIKNTKDNI